MESTERTPRWLLVLPALVFLVIAPRPARACPSCGCGDPTLTVMGAEKPFAGRVRLSLEAGTGDVGQGRPGWTELHTRDSRADLGVSWAPLDRLVLALRMPLVRRDLSRPDLSSAMAFGPGDAEVTARLVAWQDRPAFSRAQLSLIGGIKLPTAPRQSAAGVPLEMELQAGTGSLDPLAGVALSLFGPELSAYASAVAIVPGEGFEGMRSGTSLRAALTGQWQVTRWLAPRIGADLRADARGTMQGVVEPDTGGVVLYASPGVVVSPAEGLLLQATARVPVVADLVGAQRVGTVLSVGAVRDF